MASSIDLNPQSLKTQHGSKFITFSAIICLFFVITSSITDGLIGKIQPARAVGTCISKSDESYIKGILITNVVLISFLTIYVIANMVWSKQNERRIFSPHVILMLIVIIILWASCLMSWITYKKIDASNVNSCLSQNDLNALRAGTIMNIIGATFLLVTTIYTIN